MAENWRSRALQAGEVGDGGGWEFEGCLAKKGRRIVGIISLGLISLAQLFIGLFDSNFHC